MTDTPGASDLPADYSLLRRSCEPCTLRQFCAQAELRFEEVRRRGMFGRREPLARGERLFRPGDMQAAVYVVRSGALKTVVGTADGEDCMLGFHLPGELVGLDALASGQHQCEAIALVNSQVCAIPYAGLAGLTAGEPELNRRLLGVFGGAQCGHAHVQMLVRRQADERIAMFLLDMQQRYRRMGGTHAKIMLPMSREDVARYLGLALETVSRGLSRLQDLGIIAVAGRQIEVLDHAALTQLAGSPPDAGHGDEPLDQRA
ncbi:MAG: helix-turn-helix domain-containing protein [Steroidobacteraceae bacterium]